MYRPYPPYSAIRPPPLFTKTSKYAILYHFGLSRFVLIKSGHDFLLNHLFLLFTVPPSYEETMEELARRERDKNPKHDPTSPGQGVYRKRTDDDDVGYDDVGTTPEYQSAIVYSKRTDDDEVGYDDAGTTSDYQSAKPATISHTTVQPKYLQPETTLLPQSPTSPSTEPSRGSPKKNRFKKSTSRSTSRSTSSSKRDPNTYAYENQQSVDYWASVEPVTIDPNVEPILMRPMVTRVGPDGRTYLRDTSIVVVQVGIATCMFNRLTLIDISCWVEWRSSTTLATNNISCSDSLCM